MRTGVEEGCEHPAEDILLHAQEVDGALAIGGGQPAVKRPDAQGLRAEATRLPEVAQ